jgi:TRAP-type C4-dicarboxylate transport system substrate-binding protein
LEGDQGRFKVEVYPSQQLGSSREMIEDADGQNRSHLASDGQIRCFDQRLTFFDMPFLFRDEGYILSDDWLSGQEALSGWKLSESKAALNGNGLKRLQ